MTNNNPSTFPIQSTAGAIAIKNDKGEFLMQKVKVSRYVTGKRPEYAPESSSGEEEDDLGFMPSKKNVAFTETEGTLPIEPVAEDRRLRRLQARLVESSDSEDEDRVTRHRREVIEPEVLVEKSDEEAEGWRREEDSSESEEELDDEEIERRRGLLRQRAVQRKEEDEVLLVEDEKLDASEEEESSEYEEYTDSEDETGPRLKPVFVRKKDRVTIQEKEREEDKQKQLEIDAKKLAEERRKQTLKIIEDGFRKEQEESKELDEDIDAVDTGDENDEEEYETWKLRELKRMKRDREEKEAEEKDKLEIERVRNLTEEERRQDFRQNPKQVTNRAPKGKYKFLQKYYHRGSFFMNEDERVFKQDFSTPTLEDHFDKTILPKVMQVKNFGRSGRTKYTHLVDQDTTQFDSPWATETPQNPKFQYGKGVVKQNVERPSLKKKQYM